MEGVGVSRIWEPARGSSIHEGMAIWKPSESLTTRLSAVWCRNHRTISTVCPKKGWCEYQIWAIDE
jgi:hypothetical protein